MTRVSIIIPVLNRMDLTRACLDSLQRTCGSDIGRDIEIIVVDNGSTDGTFDAARTVGPPVTVVRSSTNLGFARGCNLGAEWSSGDILLFLNNDTEAHPGWLAPLVDALDDETVGVVGSQLVFPDGTLQHAGMVLVDDRRAAHPLTGVHRWRGQPADLAAANRPADLQAVCGAAMALRREVFTEVGGFDEGYWNGYEDVDLCLAVRRAGRRVRYEPGSVLTHHESSSGAERWTRLDENLVRLAAKWQGLITPDLLVGSGGIVFPGVDAGPVPMPDGVAVTLEGSMFAYHSLAQVNRELALRLFDEHGLVVRPGSAEHPEVGSTEDPRLAPFIRSALADADRLAQVTIRHQWPPDFSTPTDARPLVFIQPWEFGGLPDDWVGPLSELPDEIWCYTSWVRDCYVRSGIPAERLVVLPIGVDGTRFRPDGPGHLLRTTKSHRFLFVGGTIRRKGIDVLLDAYRRAFGPDDDVCLVVKSFGSGTVYRASNLDALLAEAAADPAGPEIELITADLDQTEMAALYRSCQTLVHPYHGEGFGMPIAEAMASGLSVVVTDDGAARDFCDEHTAFLIPSQRRSLAPAAAGFAQGSRAGYWLAEPDVDALVELLRAVVADPAAARVRAEAGRRAVLDKLDWSSITATAAARLRGLADRPARRLDPTGAAYHPGVTPYPLADPRARTLLIVAGPRRPGWEDAVVAAGRTVGPDDDVTLVVAVEADGAEHQATVERLTELLVGSTADVLAVLDPLAPADLAGLIVAADAVLASEEADDELVERVRRCRGEAIGAVELPALGDWVQATAGGRAA